MQDSLVNTQSTQFPHQYLLKHGNLANKSTCVNSTTNLDNSSNISVNLIAVSLINADSICESLVYGTPHTIKPTTCWKLDWEDLEYHQKQFQVLHTSLTTRQQYILLKLPSLPNPKGNIQPSPYFILLPGTDCHLKFLLKSIATLELVLPTDHYAEVTSIPQSIILETNNALDQLDLSSSVYNPLNYSSDLYHALASLYESHGSKSSNLSTNSYRTVNNTNTNKPWVPPKRAANKNKKKQSFPSLLTDTSLDADTFNVYEFQDYSP